MPIQYKSTRFDTPVDPESLTEQEHKDSCDVNRMILSASKGLNVRGGGSTQYGYDDTTMDAVQHRILKAKVETELKSLNTIEELSDDQIRSIPDSVKKHLKLRPKQKGLNDDQTTKMPVPMADQTKTDAPKSDTSKP